jgi:transmembrane sensor
MRIKRSNKEFLRFFLGLSNDKEKQKVYNSQESEEMLREQWDNYQDIKDKGTSFNKNEVFQRIQNELASKQKSTSQFNIFTFVSKYAAILIIGVIISGGALYFGIIKPSINGNLASIEYSNQKREKVELILPDGSKVTLNAKTSINYPKEFSKQSRNIQLSGEAYFEVIRDTTRPFIVNTSNITIEVLGTTFNVMAYSDDTIIETTLVTGKVKLSRLNPSTNKVQSVILTPNHKAVFYKADERFVLDKVNVFASLSWKLGKLEFDNEPLESMVKKLERWYDVKIVLSDNLKNKYRYTLTIDKETIEEVLEMIKKTSPINYTKANGEIVFYSSK